MPLNLSFLPFLNRVEKSVLDAVEHEVEWFCLPAGQLLFREGDDADAIYLVRSGALAAFRSGALGRPDLIGYIRTGEPVGEMSMLDETPHSASVYALRDSELVRLPKASFERLTNKHASLMRELSRMMLARLRGPRRASGSEPKVFALISTSPTIDLDYRSKEIASTLAGMGVNCGIADESCSDWSGQKLDAFEAGHDIVLLTARFSDPAWARRAMGRADRMWLFARADARPSTPLLPDDPSPAMKLKLLDVVLLHPGGVTAASRPQDWANAAEASRVFHWRQDHHVADTARLARTLSGRSVGMVVSGGGARAYAHMGAIRALREAGMPFDFVGGASMGAIIAAGIALDWSDDELEQRIRKAFVDSNPLDDWTLPVVSLAKGEKVDARLKEHFGEVEIAEMVRPFFCLSSNLASGRPQVHRTGLLRHALRASIAIPGLLPPVVVNGQILVDGAVFTNFPAREMRAFHRGPVVGVDVTRAQGLNPSDFEDPPGFIEWVRKNGLKSPPPIASLLMRAATIGVADHRDVGREAADLLILPETSVDIRSWDRFEEVRDAGYDAAQGMLAGIDDAMRVRLGLKAAPQKGG
ncbi:MULTISPECIES: patatin-like phospholipase family protein [Maricaulis]|jgi:NTE family protein|uniref:Cyclic nucleotide-binding protein n=1 Tax=Maricaulis maris (strain MCS10) TaxID=394221 RepID=Q0ANV8_MARMM|nr:MULTISPECIES: patatin-like phospholipase family protein [Maricaulis]ABI66029.1 cyclic nucleotide-binding protein [Maricaulis maris MCS10]MAC90649.1 cyclic nucleotide-binding protein [Maricaulis sp.]